ncbi:MAG: tetraacyldisaccharide 4'-kinase [Verrucomicrobiae bacterium]|nr:tetraacyldisaccharide 4'-kinase [Verrucomicrobiae bacterium]
MANGWWKSRLEALETFAVEVIYEKRRGKRAAALRGVLFAFSRLFAGIVQLRHYLYRKRIFRDHTLGCLVICVGNLTVGGTGKTPVVEKLARALQQRGRRVAILSRGYKSEPRPFLERLWLRLTFRKEAGEPRVVSDGKALLLDSATAGDEPYMLASNLKDVVVLVDKDRVKSGRYAIEQLGIDTLLLDDGFQYLSLKSRLNLVLVDRTNPFGNQHLLPRGSLREPRRNLARADYIFLTKCDGAPVEDLVKTLRRYNTRAEIIECGHKPLWFQNVYDPADRQPLAFLKGKKIGAISGIAMPDGFEESLERLGAEIVDSRQYADHHRFTQQEILNMINRSRRRFAQVIITTEKDAVRFPKLERVDVPIYFLRVEIEILRGAEDFDECVSRICLG